MEPAEIHERLPGQPEGGVEIGEVALHQVGGEDVDSGGDRGVGGEDAGGGDDLQRLGELELLLHHEPPDPLQGQEGAVAFVDVIDPGDHSQRPQRPDPPDSDDDLLANPGLGVATVQLVGDVLEVRGILRQVGVEQDQGHPADPGPPELDQRRPPGQAHLDPDRPSLVVAERADRHSGEIVDRVHLLLPSLRAQVLAEGPLLVEQADADHRQPEVAGRLEHVPGQVAEAPGDDREALGDAEFHAEVGRQRLAVLHFLPSRPASRAGDILVEIAADPVQMGEERLVLGGFLQPLLGDGGEHQDRIVVGLFPEIAIEAAEQADRLVVPRPAEVVGEILQGPQRLGEAGTDMKGLHRAHDSALQTGRRDGGPREIRRKRSLAPFGPAVKSTGDRPGSRPGI